MQTNCMNEMWGESKEMELLDLTAGESPQHHPSSQPPRLTHCRNRLKLLVGFRENNLARVSRKRRNGKKLGLNGRGKSSPQSNRGRWEKKRRLAAGRRRSRWMKLPEARELRRKWSENLCRLPSSNLTAHTSPTQLRRKRTKSPP
jgi:hypothetical protein